MPVSQSLPLTSSSLSFPGYPSCPSPAPCRGGRHDECCRGTSACGGRVRWRWQRKDGRRWRARCACHGSIPTRDPYGRSRGSQYELSRTMLLAGAGSGGMVTSEGVAWRGTVLRIGDVILTLTWAKNSSCSPMPNPSQFPHVFFSRVRGTVQKSLSYIATH